MAYMDQERKSEIVSEVKKILPNNWKATFKVLDNREIVMTIREMPKQDLLAMAYKNSSEYRGYNFVEKIPHKALFIDNIIKLSEIEINFDIYAGLSKRSFENMKSILNIDSEMAETFEKIIYALNSKNHNNNNIHYDYHDVGYYVSLKLGCWKKPCKLI